MELKDKVAIVTGGGSGLGEAMVRKMIAEGGRATILDLNEARGAALVEELGPQALFCKADVSSEAEVQAAVDATVATHGGLHIAVNCAGIPGRAGRIVSRKGPMPLADFEMALRINLLGTFNVCRLAAEVMVQNDPIGEDGERGVIVNTSSLAGIEGQMGQICYAASKAGVIGMMLPLVRDLSQFNIRTCTIAPGLFETPMGAGTPEEIKEKLVAQLEAPKRMGKPSEFASLAAHIIQNPYLNGELIRLDAGTRPPPR